jgi:hypothetical protein
MDKYTYIDYLMKGRVCTPTIMNSSLTFWYANVPAEDARIYMDNLEKAVNDTTKPTNP